MHRSSIPGKCEELMGTELTVTDTGTALEVIATVRTSALRRMVASSVAGLAVFVFTFQSMLLTYTVFCSAAAAIVSWILATRKKVYRLTMDPSQFLSSGSIGDSFSRQRKLNPEEVRWLEYQEDSSGPETAEHPKGLYAVLQFKSVCLLPEIEEDAAHQLIDTIGERFPQLQSRWRGHSAYGDGVTSLGI
jgi:hypothetical protein